MTKKFVKLDTPVKMLSHRYRNKGRPRKKDYDTSDTALEINILGENKYIVVWDN